MQRASQENRERERHKEVTVLWVTYDAHMLCESKRVIYLRRILIELDRPDQRREFQLAQVTVLLLLKLMFDISYRTLASTINDLSIYQALDMKRAPCYKTIQNTMQYLTECVLIETNQGLIP
jgi:hypothetical protein